MTCEIAREAMDALCDTIQNEARRTRDDLQSRLKRGPERRSEWDATRERLEYVNGYVDRVILCDAGHLNDKGILNRVITADKTDIYENRERINTVLGLTIPFIKDEFADSTLPQHSEANSGEQETN